MRDIRGEKSVKSRQVWENGLKSICKSQKRMEQDVCKDKDKEEIWLSPMTKAPTPAEMSKGQSDNTNNATKKFDNTALRTDLGRSVGVKNNHHVLGAFFDGFRK